MLCAACSAPFNVFIDVLFEDILCAPLAEEFKFNMKAQGLKGNIKQLKLLAANGGGVVRQSIAMTNTAIVPMFARAPISAESLLGKKSLMTRCLECLVVPGAFMRQAPPSVLDARATLAGIIRDSFQGDDMENDDDANPVQSVSKLKSRLTVVRMSVIFGKSIDAESTSPHAPQGESGGPDAPEGRGPSSSYSAFTCSLEKQGKALGDIPKVDFHARWG